MRNFLYSTSLLALSLSLLPISPLSAMFSKDDEILQKASRTSVSISKSLQEDRSAQPQLQHIGSMLRPFLLKELIPLVLSNLNPLRKSEIKRR